MQGFPITFQFYGDNFGQKLRMIGNAIPPAFSYYVAHAMIGTERGALPQLCDAISQFDPPSLRPSKTTVDRQGRRYPWDRTFRFSIASLRLKSGVRFELFNAFEEGHPGWEVGFVFGTSKSIQKVRLTANLLEFLQFRLPANCRGAVLEELAKVSDFIRQADVPHMQDVWSHSGPGLTRPFMLLDQLDEVGGRVSACLSSVVEEAAQLVADAISFEHGEAALSLPGLGKLAKNAPLIGAGLLVGSIANHELGRHVGKPAARHVRRASN